MSSYLRQWYNTIVQVNRIGRGGGPGRIQGQAVYTWVESTDLIDPDLDVPGQMACRLDVQFIRPGSQAPMPAEAGDKIPRLGTVIFDVPPMPNLIKAGDRLTALTGPFVGSTFELRVIPEPAQNIVGAQHMEAQVVEVAILPGQFPGVEPGSVTS